jgi:hypothetical protein
MRSAGSPRPGRTGLAAVVVGLLAACGSGDAGDGDGGSPFSDGGPAADAGGHAGGEPIVLFVYDGAQHAIFRLADRNDDGDLHDAGEAVRFHDASAPPLVRNSGALAALRADQVIAADVPPLGSGEAARLIRLIDEDGDGTGLDPDEARILFDGQLPGPATASSVLALAATGPGLLYALQRVDGVSAPRVYRLEDADQDGAIAGDEVAPWYELAGEATDLEADGDGQLWLIEDRGATTSVVRVDPLSHESTTALSATALESAHGLALGLGDGHVARLDDGTLLFSAPDRTTGFTVLAAMRDADGSGTIDAATEVRRAWDEGRHVGQPSNLVLRGFVDAPDGSLLALVATQGTIRRFVDGNDDGDYDDPGEDRVVYDTAQSVASGGENTADMLGLTVAAAD